jgi:hypothetical protein
MDNETKSQLTRTMFTLTNIKWGKPYGLNQLGSNENDSHLSKIPTTLTIPYYNITPLTDEEIEKEVLDTVQDIYGYELVEYTLSRL